MQKPAIEGGIPVRKSPLPFSPPYIQKQEIDEVTAVLKSGWITRGRKCEEFEEALAAYTGAGACAVLSSATAGLFLSLKLYGVGPDDEVITTPYTFAATVNAILHTGARPVFADIEQKTFNISPDEVEKKITRKTKAFIPVHFAGGPARMDAIRAFATAHRIMVIEDAAHAISASYHGRKIGSGENPAVFSFHAVKNLTTAEGGAVLFNESEFIKGLKLYSLHGQTKDAYEKLKVGNWKYDITVPGYKFNMTDIQAAIGLCQLRRLDRNRERRKDIAARYTSFLQQFDFVRTPEEEPGTTHAWHIYPLCIDFSRLSIDRDAFISALGRENIAANVHFIPVHLMSYYKKTFGYRPDDFPVSYHTYLQEVTLPLYPQLTDEDVVSVLEAVEKLFTYYKK